MKKVILSVVVGLVTAIVLFASVTCFLLTISKSTKVVDPAPVVERQS